MSRDLPHAASFDAFLARGLGPSAGVAGAAVSLLSYNVVQVSLYGLLGAVAAVSSVACRGFGRSPRGWPIGLLGVLHIGVNTRLLTAVLVLQSAVDPCSWTSPGPRPLADGHLDLGPLMPTNLMSGALGGVLAFTVSAFIGFETVAVYREEAASHRAVKVACYGTIGFLAVFYALSSWALASAVGPSKIVDVARDPSANLPFSILGENFGPLMETIGQALLITGLFAALLSFHSVVARYVYALAREGVLPANLGTLGGAHGGVPIAGSIAQTSTAAAIGIAIFAVAGADPDRHLVHVAVRALGSGHPRSDDLHFGRRRAVLQQAGAGPWLVVGRRAGRQCSSAVGDSDGQHREHGLDLEHGGRGAAVGIAGDRRTHRCPGSRSCRADPAQRRPSAYLKIGRGQPRPLAVPERVLARLEM